MKASEIRDMSPEEINQKAAELKAALFNLRFQHATGQLENTKALLKTRKDIARIQTIAREYQLKDTRDQQKL